MEHESGSLTREFKRDPEIERHIREQFGRLRREVRKVVVGEDKLIETMCIALASEASVIAESPPGEGKSLATKTIAKALNLSEGRIEFNPQIMPQEILGYKDPHTGEVNKGIIFNNLVLAEELNRASGRVKSALLGPMQEHFVILIDVPGLKLPLPRPFYMFATINPVEHARDVYRLTTAELNRFALRHRLRKKSAGELARIAVLDVDKMLESVEKVMGAEELLLIIDYVKNVSRVSEKHPVVDYISRLAARMQFVTEKDEDENGASARAVRSFWLSLNAYRIIKGLPYIGPKHVRELINRAWHHRIIADTEKRRFAIIDAVLNELVPPVPVPDEIMPGGARHE